MKILIAFALLATFTAVLASCDCGCGTCSTGTCGGDCSTCSGDNDPCTSCTDGYICTTTCSTCDLCDNTGTCGCNVCTDNLIICDSCVCDVCPNPEDCCDPTPEHETFVPPPCEGGIEIVEPTPEIPDDSCPIDPEANPDCPIDPIDPEPTDISIIVPDDIDLIDIPGVDVDIIFPDDPCLCVPDQCNDCEISCIDFVEAEVCTVCPDTPDGPCQVEEQVCDCCSDYNIDFEVDCDVATIECDPILICGELNPIDVVLQCDPELPDPEPCDCSCEDFVHLECTLLEDPCDCSCSCSCSCTCDSATETCSDLPTLGDCYECPSTICCFTINTDFEIPECECTADIRDFCRQQCYSCLCVEV